MVAVNDLKVFIRKSVQHAVAMKTSVYTLSSGMH